MHHKVWSENLGRGGWLRSSLVFGHQSGQLFKMDTINRSEGKLAQGVMQVWCFSKRPKERGAFPRGSQSSFMLCIMNVGFIFALAFPPHMRTENKGLMKWMCNKSEFMQNDSRETTLLTFPPAKVGGQRPGQRRQPHPLSYLRDLTVCKELVPSILEDFFAW